MKDHLFRLFVLAAEEVYAQVAEPIYLIVQFLWNNEAHYSTGSVLTITHNNVSPCFHKSAAPTSSQWIIKKNKISMSDRLVELVCGNNQSKPLTIRQKQPFLNIN